MRPAEGSARLSNKWGIQNEAPDPLFCAVGMTVYFSDFGGQKLVDNQYFLRSVNEIQRGDSKEKFEEGATFLTPFAKTTLQVQKVNRVFQDGNKVRPSD
jgi:hypothetical protein